VDVRCADSNVLCVFLTRRRWCSKRMLANVRCCDLDCVRLLLSRRIVSQIHDIGVVHDGRSRRRWCSWSYIELVVDLR
jgi:hypothetical protein